MCIYVLSYDMYDTIKMVQELVSRITERAKLDILIFPFCLQC